MCRLMLIQCELRHMLGRHPGLVSTLAGSLTCTGAQGGPGHMVWQAGIMLSQYFVLNPGRIVSLTWACWHLW